MTARTNLVESLSQQDLENHILMARAARPLLLSSNSTLLIVDANESVLVGEGPGITGQEHMTLSTVAASFCLSAAQIEDVRTAFRAVAHSGQVCTLECWAPPLQDPNSAYHSDSRRIRVHLARLTDDTPTPDLACLFEDLTELVRTKIAEERIQKERLSVFLGTISDAVLATDSDWHVVYVNPSAVALLQTSEAVANGELLWKLATVHDCFANRALPELLQASEKGADLEVGDCRLSLPDNTYRVITVRVRSYAATDEWAAGHVVVLHDVTQERQRSGQDVHSRKMEAIGQLSAGIAHEINTPMQFVSDNTRFFATSVATLAEAIAARLSSNEQDEELRWTLEELPNALRETRDGIERVIKIVSAMKEFSHPSGGAKSPSDINRGISATTTVARNAWKYTAHLDLDLAQDLPLVFCNLDEINQVVLNLVLNAVDAIREKQGQTGTTELGHIVVETRVVGENVVLSVRDDGIGVSAEVKSKIFDPFFTTKPVGKGTGQGLAMAHDVIVNKHGGRVEVESAVGQGTCFSVYLPCSVSEDET